MNLLLDTHIALWALTDDTRLTTTARHSIANPANRIFFSVASMWEVAIKHALKPDKLPISAVEFMHYCQQSGYDCLPVREQHIIALESLQRHHNDPFDRLLIAQAQTEAMQLLSHDEALKDYGQMVYLV